MQAGALDVPALCLVALERKMRESRYSPPENLSTADTEPEYLHGCSVALFVV